MAKRYSSVGDMLRDLLPEEGPQLAQEVEADVADLSVSDSDAQVDQRLGQHQDNGH